MPVFEVAFSEFDLQAPHWEGSSGHLLRFRNSQEEFYTCLCGWPSLGDLDFPQRREALLAGQWQALAMTSAFALGRKYGQRDQWFLPEQGVESHVLYDLADPDRLAHAIAGEFQRLKVKAKAPLGLFLAEIFFELQSFPPSVQLLLDMNLKFSPAELASAIGNLPEEERQRIWGIEDAFAGSARQWQEFSTEFGIPLWSDWYQPREAPYPLRVWKAYRDGLLCPQPETEQYIVTSYLSHPLEQYMAQAVANEWAQCYAGIALAAGCASHFAYPDNCFSQEFKVRRGVLSLPKEAKWQQHLDACDWRELGVFAEEEILG